MERMVFRCLTGVGVIAALITLATDRPGGDRLPNRSVEPPPQITVLVVERNGAKLIPYAVCTVPQVGE